MRRSVKSAAIMLAATAMIAGVAWAQTTRSFASWQPKKEVILRFEKARPSLAFRESSVPNYQLPDALVRTDGPVVSDPAEWTSIRRPELLKLFQEYIYGHTPAAPADIRFEEIGNDPTALNGQATLRRTKIILPLHGGQAFSFETALFVPNGHREPVPAFILINNRGNRAADPARAEKGDFWPVEQIIARGYATAVFRTSDVQPDDKTKMAEGLIGAWPQVDVPADQRWGALAAWAFGASRVLDYLQTIPQIDSSRVAVIGHSRGGKAALWAGATDVRFALTISNDSGCGGAAISRRMLGEDVASITTEFPHWFCGRFTSFAHGEPALPVDQHELLALLAPRGVYVASADEDLWADPRGEFLSLAHASKVYRLFGNADIQENEMPALDMSLVRGVLGYHIRSGGHDLGASDWPRYLDFADRLFIKR